jgi:hypothetical protein
MLQSQSIDIGRALTHIREDADWLKKLGMGLLVSVVPFLSFAGVGYGQKVLKNASEGRDTPLPEWNDISALFVSGLKLLVPMFVYSLPVLLLTSVFQVIAVGAAAASESGGDAAMEAAMGGIGLVGICLYGLIMLYALFLSYLMPAIQIQFARTNENIGATLKLGEILQIARTNSSEYLKAFIGLIGVSFLGSLLTMVTCGLGIFAIAPLSFIVGPHLAGQYKRIAGL